MFRVSYSFMLSCPTNRMVVFFGGSHPQAEGSSICKLGSCSKNYSNPLTAYLQMIPMLLKWH